MVTVVIPVYNEEKTIKGLVESLLAAEGIIKIIIVDDGSTDNSSQLIEKLPVKIIKKEKNQGKDLAVLAGVKAADTKKVLLVDGDLKGLNNEHIKKLLQKQSDYRMTLGVLKPRGLFGWLFFLNRYFFTRTGLRLVNRLDILNIPVSSLGKYRLESILSSLAYKNSWPVKRVILSDIIHVIKEKKGGLRWGMLLRAEMIFDILAFYGEKIFRS